MTVLPVRTARVGGAAPARASTLLKRVARLGLGVAILSLPHFAAAAASLPGITSTPTPDGGQQWSIELQTLLLVTSLAFLPAILLMMTCFTRVIVVLSLLRTAMGTQSAPPNQVLLGLTLFLTFFVMAPTITHAYDTAWQPLSSGKLSMQQALQTGAEPAAAGIR
ncbi:MAG: hypothetical protein ACREPF_11280 [Rhodanobacteraceae bacterium]